MLNRISCAVALAVCVGSARASDILHLKGDAAILGKILANKPEQVAVDIGYTVLVIPREQIIDISKTDSIPETEPAKTAPSLPPKIMVPTAATRTVAAHAGESNGVFQDGDASGPDRSVRDLVAVLGEAVVQVRTPSGLGSGFIINDDGYLITNFHVIENETQISVEVYHQKSGQLERRSYKQVRILAMNKFADLALLKIEDKNAPKFVSVPLGESDELGVGERVFAIGSPLGLERTVTEGIVSTKTRPMQGELYLQTTTQINPGNSGGPLFDLRGAVVGVTNMKIAFGEGLGFAIPVDAVKNFLNHRDAFAYDNDNPTSPYRYLEPPSRLTKLAPTAR
jgi:serine protease Do